MALSNRVGGLLYLSHLEKQVGLELLPLLALLLLLDTLELFIHLHSLHDRAVEVFVSHPLALLFNAFFLHLDVEPVLDLSLHSS